MKYFAYQKRMKTTLEVGDLVYLKLQTSRQASLALRKNLKLSSKYFGPYKVLAKIGIVAYKRQLSPSAKIHPIFHVSLLKKKVWVEVRFNSNYQKLMAVRVNSNVCLQSFWISVHDNFKIVVWSKGWSGRLVSVQRRPLGRTHNSFRSNFPIPFLGTRMLKGRANVMICT